MKIKPLKKEEIDLAKTIDRSEIIDEVYYFEEDGLILKKEHWDVKGWEAGHLEQHIEEMKEARDRGGLVAGAFEHGKLVGIVALESEFMGKEEDTLQLTFLHVSNRFRKKGLGRALVDLTKIEAKERGARKLYISASPSKSTIDFYFGCGAVLAEKLDLRLFALEPEDIHLELALFGNPKPQIPMQQSRNPSGQA